MSLLGGTDRSDSAGSLTVQGCAIARVSGGSVSAGFHVRPAGEEGKQIAAVLQRLLSSAKFQSDITVRERLTVDDGGVSVHCMLAGGDLVLLACTKPDYPQRLVFPPNVDGALAVGLLAHVGDIAADANLPDPAVTAARVKGLQVHTLPPRVLQGLERACADHEDVRSRDAVLRVQGEVDEVRGLMRDNIDAVLINQDKMKDMGQKADRLVDISSGFYSNARTTRRQAQWTDFKMKAVLGGIVGFFVLWWIWPWIFGS